MKRAVFALASLAALLVPSCIDMDAGKKPKLETHVADWRNEIIYQVLVDRFANGDSANDFNLHPEAPARYHGGDWLGLENQLDYIQALGVTTIWISPIVKNIETDAGIDGYHGYWAQDLTQLNSHFGDIAALRHFIGEAHDRDLKVVLDIVTNHLGQLFFYDINGNGQPDENVQGSGPAYVGSQSPVTHVTEYDPDFDARGIQAYTSLGIAGPANIIFLYDPATNKVPVFPAIFQKPEAYHRRGRIVDYAATVRRCQADYTIDCGQCPDDPNNCFDYLIQQETGDFPGGLKDVNTENPDVRAAMVDAYAHWVEETDLDGFRIDTLKHVEHQFWQTFAPAVRQRLAAQGKQNFFMFGESFDGDDAKDGSYTQNEEVDSVFYFPQKYQVFDNVFKYGQATTAVRNLWSQRAAHYGNDPHTNAIGLPPTKVLVNFLDNHDVPRFLFDKPDVNALHAALFFQMTEDGIPCVYYGTEQDFNGGNDPSNREDLWRSGYRQDGATFRHIARLTGLRKRYPALTRGAANVVYDTDHVGDEEDAGMLAFERTGDDAGDEYALAVINTNANHTSHTHTDMTNMTVSLAAGTQLTDVWNTGNVYTVGSDQTVDVELDPYGVALLVPSDQVR